MRRCQICALALVIIGGKKHLAAKQRKCEMGQLYALGCGYAE